MIANKRKKYLMDVPTSVPKRTLYNIRHSTPVDDEEELPEEIDVTLAESAINESSSSDDSSDELDISYQYFEKKDSPPPKETSEDTPFYKGAPEGLNERMAYLLIFQYCVRHNLSTKASDDLLYLLSVFLPSNTNIPKSTYKLKNYFIQNSHGITTQDYCDICHKLLQKGENCSCNGTISQFVTVPLGSQLKSRLENPNIWKVVTRATPESSVITDIQGGQRHKAFTASTHPKMLTLVVNTDGMQLFKSSSVAMWPIWILVNELPTHMRFSKNNKILAGLWCSRDKPTMHQFLKPLIKSLNELYEKGIEVSTLDGIVTVKAAMLAFSCDLPARCLVLNMTQFNGAYSCHLCIDSGKNMPSNPLIRWWPYNNNNEGRNQETMLQDSMTAVQNNAPCRGMKGASVLALHRPFNLNKGVVIDSLHCLYLGVSLKMLRLWFGKDNRSNPFSIRTKIDLCDRRLLNIKVPDRISRTPQSLAHFERWKGSEHKSWVLFYSIPVLRDVFSDECFFQHWCLLVASIHILESDHIESDSLDQAQTWLIKFYKEFEEFYGERNCTMNVHLLIHIVDCVRDWGPLWAYSCFTFESANNKLKKLFHGTRDMSKQMTLTYVLNQTLTESTNYQPSTPVGHLHNILFGFKSYKKQLIGEGTWALGGMEFRHLSTADTQRCQDYYSEDNLQCIPVFKRLEKQGEVFFCKEYARVTKRNSHTIAFMPDNIGFIQYFLYYKGKAAALVQLLAKLPIPGSFFPASGTVPVVLQDTYQIIGIEDILEKLIFIEINKDFLYIAKFPCHLKYD